MIKNPSCSLPKASYFLPERKDLSFHRPFLGKFLFQENCRSAQAFRKCGHETPHPYGNYTGRCFAKSPCRSYRHSANKLSKPDRAHRKSNLVRRKTEQTMCGQTPSHLIYAVSDPRALITKRIILWLLDQPEESVSLG